MERYALGFVLTMFVVMNIYGVYASSNINLVLDTYSLDLCPYSTKMITGYVENTGSYDEEVKIFSNSKWITIAQNSLVVKPGEKKYITLFITPTDEAKPTIYYAKIYASSKQSEDIENIEINVLDCSDITLDFSKTIYDACIGDVLKIPFYIENNGKLTENVVLETEKGNLEFYETVLDSYERDKNYLYYKVVSDYASFWIRAKSQNSFANDEKKIYVRGENCYSFSTTVIPQSVDACMKDTAVFDIYIKNTGSKENTINVRSSYGVLSDTKIVLQPEEEKIIKLRVKPEKIGESAIKVEIWDKVNYEFRDLQLTGKECSSNAMIVVPSNMEVCKGSAARYVIGVRNLGEIEENIKLISNIGEFDNSEIKVLPGEIAYKELYVPTEDLPYGNHTIEINLTKGDKVIDTIQANMEVRNCYNGEIETPYKRVDACKFTPTKPIEVIIRNTGEREETYMLNGKYGYFIEDVVKLEPMEERIVKYIVNVSEDVAEGVLQDVLTLKGVNMVTSKETYLDINLLKESACSNFTVTVEPLRIDAQEYKGYIYKVKIKNNGFAPNTFTVEMDEDYGMVYVEPESISLDPNGQGTIFLYVAPTSKMPNKEYVLKGKVLDKYNNEKTFEVVFNLIAFKEEFNEDALEDKIRVRVEGLDKEKIYFVSKENITTLQVEYLMEGKTEVEEILFVGGSFIIQIGDELYEDNNPEIGRKTYIINANNKTYYITVKFVYVDNEKSEYKFKIEEIIIEKEKKVLYGEKKELVKIKIDWKWILPVLLIILGIGWIIYDYYKNGKNKPKKQKNGKKRKKEIKELKEVVEK